MNTGVAPERRCCALSASVSPVFRAPRRAALGFTMVELVVVVILLSILSVTAISRFVKPSAFAPGIVTQALVSEARFAQQLAMARHDAVVTLVLDRAATDWRVRVLTDVDGVVRTERVESANTDLFVTSGAANGNLSAATPLVVGFGHSGDLTSVVVGATPGDPDAGVSLVVSGDSNRQICIYPSGYANDASCV
ncbi:MAG: prepilin-type N-terminal cleavage/methylation domain-containing protein [Pseudomonadales bacterium]